MIKYLFCILLGILIFILINNINRFSIGIGGKDEGYEKHLKTCEDLWHLVKCPIGTLPYEDNKNKEFELWEFDEECCVNYLEDITDIIEYKELLECSKINSEVFDVPPRFDVSDMFGDDDDEMAVAERLSEPTSKSQKLDKKDIYLQQILQSKIYDNETLPPRSTAQAQDPAVLSALLGEMGLSRHQKALADRGFNTLDSLGSVMKMWERARVGGEVETEEAKDPAVLGELLAELGLSRHQKALADKGFNTLEGLFMNFGVEVLEDARKAGLDMELLDAKNNQNNIDSVFIKDGLIFYILKVSANQGNSNDQVKEAIKINPIVVTSLILENLNFSSISEDKKNDFSGVNLFRASLNGSYFNNSILRNVDFRMANCSGTNFTECDLRGADFRGAQNLDRAIFNGVILTDTKFTEAKDLIPDDNPTKEGALFEVPLEEEEEEEEGEEGEEEEDVQEVYIKNYKVDLLSQFEPLNLLAFKLLNESIFVYTHEGDGEIQKVTSPLVEILQFNTENLCNYSVTKKLPNLDRELQRLINMSIPDLRVKLEEGAVRTSATLRGPGRINMYEAKKILDNSEAKKEDFIYQIHKNVYLQPSQQLQEMSDTDLEEYAKVLWSNGIINRRKVYAILDGDSLPMAKREGLIYLINKEVESARQDLKKYALDIRGAYRRQPHGVLRKDYNLHILRAFVCNYDTDINTFIQVPLEYEGDIHFIDLDIRFDTEFWYDPEYKSSSETPRYILYKCLPCYTFGTNVSIFFNEHEHLESHIQMTRKNEGRTFELFKTEERRFEDIGQISYENIKPVFVMWSQNIKRIFDSMNTMNIIKSLVCTWLAQLDIMRYHFTIFYEDKLDGSDKLDDSEITELISSDEIVLRDDIGPIPRRNYFISRRIGQYYTKGKSDTSRLGSRRITDTCNFSNGWTVQVTDELDLSHLGSDVWVNEAVQYENASSILYPEQPHSESTEFTFKMFTHMCLTKKSFIAKSNHIFVLYDKLEQLEEYTPLPKYKMTYKLYELPKYDRSVFRSDIFHDYELYIKELALFVYLSHLYDFDINTITPVPNKQGQRKYDYKTLYTVDPKSSRIEDLKLSKIFDIFKNLCIGYLLSIQDTRQKLEFKWLDDTVSVHDMAYTVGVAEEVRPMLWSSYKPVVSKGADITNLINSVEEGIFNQFMELIGMDKKLLPDAGIKLGEARKRLGHVIDPAVLEQVIDEGVDLKDVMMQMILEESYDTQKLKPLFYSVIESFTNALKFERSDNERLLRELGFTVANFDTSDGSSNTYIKKLEGFHEELILRHNILYVDYYESL